MDIAFIKMHGISNDFIIIDSRQHNFHFTPTQIQRLANRRIGIGCDQLLVLEFPQTANASAFMRIYNADGSEAEACGNGIRCVAWWLSKQESKAHIIVETKGGLLPCHVINDDQVQVSMGQANVTKQERHFEVEIGNPHIVCFVEDCHTVDWDELRQKHGHDVNIGAAQILDRQNLNLQVWERGAGLTQSCGSGACAAVVAANTSGLVSASCNVNQPGGSLAIEIKPDRQVILTGEVTFSYKGVIDSATLD